MSVQLRTWRDGLCWKLADRAFACDREQGQLIELCRAFEADYYRLRADSLLQARVEVLDAARSPWPLARAKADQIEAAA